MDLKRKPFQGVVNIIRFNWHFYVISAIFLCLFILFKESFPANIERVFFYLIILASIFIANSLLISYYIYDLSNLYQLSWLPNSHPSNILNINAGFDETSHIIHSKYADSELTVCDFYNPQKHTEISIARARKAYPPYPKTIQISTNQIPFADNTFDLITIIFAAHEIRNNEERILFFKELSRILKPSGKIVVTEHLRDINNLLAYNIGFFHFLPRSAWYNTFSKSNLDIHTEKKSTVFISNFTLQKNGNSL
jgi:ubiquinone/menaquinone biosynthesis C-methylase UbiE